MTNQKNDEMVKWSVTKDGVVELKKQYGIIITDAGLAELRDQYATVPKVESNADLKKLKGGITIVRTIRTAVEKKRKVNNEDAQKYISTNNIEAKRITAELLEIEEPWKDEQAEYEKKVAAEKAEKARIEMERIAVINVKIDTITALPASLVNSPSMDISVILDGLDKGDDFDYQELEERYKFVWQNTCDVLVEMLESATAREMKEKAVAERERLAEIERKEVEAERERLEAEESLRKQEATRLEEEVRVKREKDEETLREAVAIENEKLAKERKEVEAERVVLEKEKAALTKMAAPPEPPPEPEPEKEPVVLGVVECPGCGMHLQISERGELVKVEK